MRFRQSGPGAWSACHAPRLSRSSGSGGLATVTGASDLGSNVVHEAWSLRRSVVARSLRSAAERRPPRSGGMFARHCGTAVSQDKLAELGGRIGAYALHALRDPRETTAAARKAFMAWFEDEVDPDRLLPEQERQRRARAARKAYFTRLALLSAKARRARRSNRQATKPPRLRPGPPARVGDAPRSPSPQQSRRRSAGASCGFSSP